MTNARTSRRRLLKSLSVAAVGVYSSISATRAFASPIERPSIAVVGCGSRWGWQLANGGRYGVGPNFAKYADYVAVCDVDQDRVDAAAKSTQSWGSAPPEKTIDYGEILQRDDVDAVLVFTPDHWHAKIAVEAMKAGKDVYCEKPMTLTIEEGQQICDVAKSTGRVMQVGTQQRSDPKFLTAIAMIRDGRIGNVRRVTCGVGGGPTSPVIPATTPPKTLDWNRWLGPVPEMEYRMLSGAKNETKSWSNNHYEFRWWYEFSGGKLTDWGAHHVDIATWGIDRTAKGILKVKPTLVEHPVEFVDGMPQARDRYNTATRFEISVHDPSGVELVISSAARNGILFEGDGGKLFVNRGTLAGAAVDELKTRPLPEGAVREVFKGRDVLDKTRGFGSLAHVQNFFLSARDRVEPISDVHSHHAALTTCHLAGIAARLDQEIRWDLENESIIENQLAASMIGRERRVGFE